MNVQFNAACNGKYYEFKTPLGNYAQCMSLATMHKRGGTN
jgi:hypothetical protein